MTTMQPREALDTALYLLERPPEAAEHASGMTQLLELLRQNPSVSSQPVFEERLSSLLQALLGHVGGAAGSHETRHAARRAAITHLPAAPSRALMDIDAVKVLGSLLARSAC